MHKQLITKCLYNYSILVYTTCRTVDNSDGTKYVYISELSNYIYF